MVGRNSRALIYVAWVEKLNTHCLFAPLCQKIKIKMLVCWSQVQMKQTNLDFRGLITNRDVWTLLPILHDWLLSPERQPCPIEINRIFAVGFPGTKISFPIIHHLILGMSFSNWFTANLQKNFPYWRKSFFFFSSFFPIYNKVCTSSSTFLAKGMKSRFSCFVVVVVIGWLDFLVCFVLFCWFSVVFCFCILLHTIISEMVPPGHDCFRQGCGKLRI